MKTKNLTIINLCYKLFHNNPNCIYIIEDDYFIHDRDMKWLIDSDLIIAEVTNPSLGVGYEIGRALEYDKKIICLYRKDSPSRLSAMISGSKLIQVLEYKDFNDLKTLIVENLN